MLVMCRFFAVSRRGYYSFINWMNRPEKDAALAETIRQQQEKCFHTYGYRRMWQWLQGNKGIYHNPKTILRFMKKYGLLAEIRRRRRWQRMGEQLHKYENLLNRDFHAQNTKQQMGHGYFLHSNQVRGVVPVYDPRSVRQQHCGLQDRNGAKCESGSGYHSPGNTQGKKEGRRGVAAPQRPGCSVRLTSIF